MPCLVYFRPHRQRLLLDYSVIFERTVKHLAVCRDGLIFTSSPVAEPMKPPTHPPKIIIISFILSCFFLFGFVLFLNVGLCVSMCVCVYVAVHFPSIGSD